MYDLFTKWTCLFLLEWLIFSAIEVISIKYCSNKKRSGELGINFVKRGTLFSANEIHIDATYNYKCCSLKLKQWKNLNSLKLKLSSTQVYRSTGKILLSVFILFWKQISHSRKNLHITSVLRKLPIYRYLFLYRSVSYISKKKSEDTANSIYFAQSIIKTNT